LEYLWFDYIIDTMKIHRFIGRPEDPEITKQIHKVLKLIPGEQVIFGDGNGHDTLYEITDGGFEAIKTLEPVGADRKVHLYLAILKKENFELAVQKAVECGVTSITPVITERTIKTGLNVARLNKIIKEATEQSGRSFLPVLSPILNFSPALAFGSAAEEKIIFHPGHIIYSPKKTAKSVSIFVGPEGGFTEREIDEARTGLYVGASLGDLTLRGETAAIVGTYLAVNSL